MMIYMIIGLSCVLATTYIPGFERDMSNWAANLKGQYSATGFVILWSISTLIIAALWPLLFFALLQGIWSGIKKR